MSSTVFRMSSTVFIKMLVLLGCKDMAQMTGGHCKTSLRGCDGSPPPARTAQMPSETQRQALLFPLSVQAQGLC